MRPRGSGHGPGCRGRRRAPRSRRAATGGDPGAWLGTDLGRAGGGRTARDAEEPADSDEEDGTAGGGTGGGRRTGRARKYLRECLLGRFLFFFQRG